MMTENLIKFHPKKQKNIMYAAGIIYLCFLAIERIELLNGEGTFNLSLEFLGCTIFVVCYLCYIIGHKGKILLSAQLLQYTKLMTGLIITVLVSVAFSADTELSVRRAVLLCIYAISGLIAVNYFFTCYREKMTSIVVSAMIFLSIIYFVFSIYDVFMWFNYSMLSRMSNLFPFFKSNLMSLGSTFVRARGASGDPNRAGIFMIINSYFILSYCKHPALKFVVCSINIATLALTISRTSMLCLLLYVILQARVSKKFSRKAVLRIAIIALLIIAILIGLYQIPVINEAVGHTFDRMQTRDESANEHISFIEIGINAAISNPKILLFGNGYGASAVLLGHGKYSNFHNAFVSFLAECGLLSLIFFVLLLFYPLQKNRSNFPIIAVLILANIPYQIYIEPYFWFILPFICVMPQLQHKDMPEGGK